MLSFEKFYIQEGYSFIAGIDEVGRGPLAGPVCSAAVILPNKLSGDLYKEIRDSKELSEKKRQDLAIYINDIALAIGIGLSCENIIDEINILEATKLSMENAVQELSKILKPDLLLIDGNFSINIDIKQKSIIKGGSKSISIASASIIAKVYRDQIMCKYHELFPEYNFKKNKGYGTLEHCEIIASKGICKIHRKTFKKVKEYVF